VNNLLTTREVAQRLRVHINTLHSLIHSGKLKAIKIEGRWKVTETDLQEFVDGYRK
jgi:excisionase family DNA binding protein